MSTVHAVVFIAGGWHTATQNSEGHEAGSGGMVSHFG